MVCREAVEPRRAVPRAVTVSLACLLVASVVYTVQALTHVGGVETETFFGRWVYDAILVGPCVLMVVRCVRRARERAAWVALTAGMSAWTLAQVHYSIALYTDVDPPAWSYGDLGFLLFYPAAFVALVRLLRARVVTEDRMAWLDGIIGALSLTAVGAAVVFPSVLASLGGSVLVATINS
jgi:hypothetical protein